MKILLITGIRSEYDILYSVLSELRKKPGCETGLVITGAHLAELYGRTADFVEAEGFPVVGHIESLSNSDSAAARIKSAAAQLLGLTDIIEKYNPDVLIAMGDREEALTMATAGAYMGIPVGHIGGGDFAEDGNVDNLIRDAVTKLAHIHFAASKKSAERIVRMGEEEWRVHSVGAPGLDRLLSTESISRKELGSFLNFDLTRGPFILMIQHPISPEISEAEQQIRTTLEAVKESGIRALVSYPNSDAGSQGMIRVIQEFESNPQIKVYKSLPRNIFVNLLKSVDVLIGNSSCGIIEAPLLKLPVVNIGKRQLGREHGDNVLFVDHDVKQIQQAIQTALYDETFRSAVQNGWNPYGDGKAGERIAQILSTLEINSRLLTKRMQ